MRSFKRLLATATSFAVVFGLVGPMTTFAAGPAAVNLSTAADFTILAKTGISTTGSTAVTGDIGVSPIAATSITGFGLILAAESPFATSALVSGKVYAPGYADPTPAKMTTAVADMETAYADAAGRTNPTATELGAGNIGGLTIAPGLYKWGTGVIIPTDVILSGSANDIWIFQVAQTLDLSAGKAIVLTGGAQANNVFWVVGGQTTIGTTATFNGNILGKTAIVLNTGATLNGRALAQTAVTLDSSAVTVATSSGSTPAPTPEPTPAPTPTPTPTPVPTPTPAPDLTPTYLPPIRSIEEEAKWEAIVNADIRTYNLTPTVDQTAAVIDFITYGNSAETVLLGSGERRALIRDYFDTVGYADINWNDIQRLATGQKPLVRNLAKEQARVGAVLSVYMKIVGHTPNFSVPKEDLIWNTLMYRVRFTRDLNSERSAIGTFQSHYKRIPTSPLDWAAVRAWAYVVNN